MRKNMNLLSVVALVAGLMILPMSQSQGMMMMGGMMPMMGGMAMPGTMYPSTMGQAWGGTMGPGYWRGGVNPYAYGYGNNPAYQGYANPYGYGQLDAASQKLMEKMGKETAALEALMSAKDPDKNKIMAKQKEISELRSKIEEQMMKSRLEGNAPGMANPQAMPYDPRFGVRGWGGPGFSWGGAMPGYSGAMPGYGGMYGGMGMGMGMMGMGMMGMGMPGYYMPGAYGQSSMGAGSDQMSAGSDSMGMGSASTSGPSMNDVAYLKARIASAEMALKALQAEKSPDPMELKSRTEELNQLRARLKEAGGQMK